MENDKYLIPRVDEVNVGNVGEVIVSVKVTFAIGEGNAVLANLGRPPVESVVGPSPFKDAPDALSSSLHSDD